MGVRKICVVGRDGERKKRREEKEGKGVGALLYPQQHVPSQFINFP
jgi:hypothetical protein